jgi:hypothetical protein
MPRNITGDKFSATSFQHLWCADLELVVRINNPETSLSIPGLWLPEDQPLFKLSATILSLLALVSQWGVPRQLMHSDHS